MIPPLLALFSFPIVVLALFTNLRPVTAMAAAMILGYLFLPQGQGLNLPLLPTLDKHSIPAFTALIAMLILLGKSTTPNLQCLQSWVPRSPLVLFFLVLIILGAFGTALTNRDPLVFSIRTIPGLRFFDGPSLILGALTMLLPFFLARRFLGHPDTHPMLLWLLMLAGLAYSLPAIYEARMSPQLNVNIYGYFQHIWAQHIRADGFRPIVFLEHGLWVSLFFSSTFLSAVALYRDKVGSQRGRYLAAALWLLGTLFLTKSLGAFVIALALAPVILFLNMRLQLLIAAFIAIVVMLYPVLRSSGLVPIDKVYSMAESIKPNRALSLGTRLDNEAELLDKAQLRPFFGWGGWGRNRIYNDEGVSRSITDGFWVILIGQRGWIGYIGIFGLLSVGIFGLVWQARRLEITPATAGLAVVLAGNMVDLIPNAGITVLTWMMAGALLGRLEHGRISDTAVSAVPETGRRTLRYSRFGAGPATSSGAVPEPNKPAPAFAQTAEPRGSFYRRTAPAPDTTTGSAASLRACKGRRTRFEERHDSS